MNIARWFLGVIVFLALSLLILKYGELSINLLILIALAVFLFSLIQNKKREKKNY